MSNPDPLRQELQALQQETQFLRQRLGAVEARLAQLAASAAPAVPPALPPALATPAPIAPQPRRVVLQPPPLPDVVAAGTALPPVVPAAGAAPVTAHESASPLEPRALPALLAVPQTAAPPLPPLPAAVPPAQLPPQLPAEPKREESFELRIFVYWGVRVAIGLLLLGVVYFAVYLYQTHIPRLGPGAKMALLYLASGGLLGCGEWLRRRAGEEPRMQTFAAIVEGGGFGAVYFTTLAGHVFAPLRIFESAALTLGLLFGLGAFVLWWAERRDAAPLATVALLSAGLSAAVMPGSWIALLGTAVFAALGVGQWWRLGWIGPSVASLVASYGAYGWWRYQVGLGLSPTGNFATEAVLLALYWLIFTAGVLAPREARAALRTAFLTANNVAAYCLLARIIAAEHPTWFWRFTLASGVLLLVLAAQAHRRLGTSEANAYRVQGLILGTLAIVSYFSGWQLGLMLCLESLALAAAASWRDSRLFLVAGWLAGALGVLAQVDYAALTTTSALVGGGASAACLLGAAWIALHRPLAEARSHAGWFTTAAEVWSVLAAGLGVLLLVREADAHSSIWLAVALGLWGLALTLAHQAVAARALPIAGFLIHLGGFAVWGGLELQRKLGRPLELAAWVPLAYTAFSIAHDLIRRWRATLLGLPTSALVMASSAVALAHFLDGNAWTLAAAGLAAGWVLYGWRFRDPVFAVGAQALLAAACLVALARELDHHGPGLWPTLALALAPVALRALAQRLVGSSYEPADQEFVEHFRLAVVQTVVQLAFWVLVAVPDPWKPLAFASIALAAAALGRWRGAPAGATTAAGAIALTLVFTLAGFGRALHWSQALALATAFAASEIARSGGLSEVLTNLFALLRGGLLAFGFFWISLRLQSNANAALFTAIGWTLYALLLMVVGLWRRDRLVRMGALIVFALTIGRVLIYEAWSLGPLYRMASFMVLGFVLLLLGWVFTKYQDKLREWL
ncbi:MAG: DUF2339 domain-containing protein [Verrucomicrobia bacterium]|nr:DUF2339 domain-containing protein [Verrucomicrobiota bacterium]